MFVECRAPDAVLERRVRARARQPDRTSDATPEVLHHQLADLDPFDEVPPERHVIVRSDQPVDRLVAAIEDAIGLADPPALSGRRTTDASTALSRCPDDRVALTVESTTQTSRRHPVSKIIVGVDGSDRSDDALALASSLARRTAAEIVLARAYPYDDAAGHLGDSSRRHHLREDAQQTLDRLREHADASLQITTRTIADPSPSRALHTLAEREGAALVVIGSSHHGAVGRVFAGTTAERLLHGSPCPVAVAPRGMAHGESISRIAVGWDRSAEASAALTAAIVDRPRGRRGAAHRRGPRHPVGRDARDHPRIGRRARCPSAGGPRSGQPRRGGRRPSRATCTSETAVVLGHPVGDLVRQSEDADLLVLGSRGYGPRRAVLLGGVSGRVVRKAACPVIVVPRGVESAARGPVPARLPDGGAHPTCAEVRHAIARHTPDVRLGR